MLFSYVSSCCVPCSTSAHYTLSNVHLLYTPRQMDDWIHWFWRAFHIQQFLLLTSRILCLLVRANYIYDQVESI